MRTNFLVGGGRYPESRLCLTATRVRREVLLDIPPTMSEPQPGYAARVRFSLLEAEAFLALLTQAVVSARE